MNTTVISVKVDKETKEAAQKLARSTGLSLSALINSYLKQVVATRRIELHAPEEMTPALEGFIAEVESEIASGKVSKSYKTTKELIKALKS